MAMGVRGHCLSCMPGEDPDMDRLRAVQRLVDNHEAVTKFAARGCGQQGSPPVNAPLSDPNARPGMDHLHAVDAGQLTQQPMSCALHLTLAQSLFGTSCLCCGISRQVAA